MKEYTERSLRLYSVYSRALVLLIQITFNYLIADHKLDVFNPPEIARRVSFADSVVEFTLGGFRRWDSIYMIHIAEHGYTYENTLAFFPLFPFLVRITGYTVLYPLHFIMTVRHVLMVSAFLVNTTCFVLATKYLYKLAQLLIGKGNLPWFTCILFCFNPASIFMSSAYSESSFALFSFATMYYTETEQFTKCTVALALATATRSNGLVLGGYPLYMALKIMLTIRQQQNFRSILHRISDWMKAISCVMYGLAPFVIYQYMCFVLYCKNRINPNIPRKLIEYGKRRGYHLPDDKPSEWCYHQIPYSYGYIQSHHWNVGPFHYFEWKQLPNFVLAMPVILLSLYSIASKLAECRNEVRVAGKYRLSAKSVLYLPYMLHLFFIVVYSFVNVHVQILTRMIFSSSPLIYICLSRHLCQYVVLKKRSFFLTLLLTYAVMYFILGTILHSNFFPWT